MCTKTNSLPYISLTTGPVDVAQIVDAAFEVNSGAIEVKNIKFCYCCC